jgi:hypothetical protein
MNNKFPLVHIGLGKSASTSLQSIWQASANYNFFSANQLGLNAEQIILENINDIDSLVGKLNALRLPPPNQTNEISDIVSSEGLTFTWIDSPELAAFIPLKQKALANAIGPVCERVLLLCRNPVDWIRSMHAQSVKEGGSARLTDYMTSHSEVIKNNMDLSGILSYWMDAGCDVTVLPFELFVSDPAAFWMHYTNLLGLPIPDQHDMNLSVFGKNTTRYDSLAIHAEMNRLLQQLESICQKGDFPDKDTVLPALVTARKWGTRRALSVASSEDLELLEDEWMGSAKVHFSSSNELLVLNDSLKEFISYHYLQPVKPFLSMIDRAISDAYQRSLEHMHFST